ncbi:MAG: RDD family protein [Candidatus Heimdallarchaeota archaeon]
MSTEKTQTLKADLATLQQRIFAGLIDWAIMAAIMIVIEIIPSIFSWIAKTAIMYLIANILYALLNIVAIIINLYYFVWRPTRKGGQTVGKKIIKTKVVIIDDPEKGTVRDVTKDDLVPMFIRWLLLIVDGIFFGAIGLLLIYMSADNQRLGDQLAKTAVVVAPEAAK